MVHVNQYSQISTDVLGKSDNAFPLVSAHISSFNIGAPIEYVHSIVHLSDHYALREVS